MLSTVKDSSCSTARPGSNVTPRRMTGVRSGVNRITQPFASTRLPGGVPGHLSRSSGTPSPSESYVEQVARVSEIEAEARTAQRQRGRGGSRAGAQVLVAGVEFGADDVGKEVTEPCAAAHATLEPERLVVVRERAESAEFELMRALRAGGAARRRKRHDQDPGPRAQT